MTRDAAADPRQTVCPTCKGNGTFTPVDDQTGERCPYCPHLYPAGRMATIEEIRAHLDKCDGSSAHVVTVNAELYDEEDEAPQPRSTPHDRS